MDNLYLDIAVAVSIVLAFVLATIVTSETG
jgi:hypothetical protein